MSIENRTIFQGDNLPILRGMITASVDLIYLDPPFNSNKTYSAPIGSEAAGAAFKDSWTLDDVKDEWHRDISKYNSSLYRIIESAELAHSTSMKAYLIMMSIRLIEMQRILKPNGSIYLHCDPTASHYLKMIMDSVFNKENFRNEIVWGYNRFSRKSERQFARMNDIILFYSSTINNNFNMQYIDSRNSDRYKKGYHTVVDKGIRKLLVYDMEKVKNAGIDLSKYDRTYAISIFKVGDFSC